VVSEQIDAKAPARLGGWFYLTIEMMPGERLLRSGQASRQHTPLSGAAGRLYLTNMRLIWSPLRPLAWVRLARRVQGLALTEIARCEEGEPSFYLGWPIDVYTSHAQYRYHVLAPIIGRALRVDAQDWVVAISREAERARGNAE